MTKLIPFIVTLDVYIEAYTRNDAIEAAMAGLERGGLNGDLLDAQQGEAPDAPVNNGQHG